MERSKNHEPMESGDGGKAGTPGMENQVVVPTGVRKTCLDVLRPRRGGRKRHEKFKKKVVAENMEGERGVANAVFPERR